MCAFQAHYGSEFTLYVASDKFAHSAMAGLKQHRVHIPVFMLALMLFVAGAFAGSSPSVTR